MGLLSVGVDTGGTFTDSVLLDEGTGRLYLDKRLTTPQDPSRAILDGVGNLLKKSGIDFSEVRKVVHGTTLVANLIIERKGARTALITTEGFRDILDIGREIRYDIYDLTIRKPPPLSPRYLRMGLRERVDHAGKVVTPIAADDVEALVEKLSSESVDSIAICLLHSYANPIHERELRDLLNERLPGIEVTASSDLISEIREYERASTTVANAYVKPLMRRYLNSLDEMLRRAAFRGRLYIMMSNGGIASTSTAADGPIGLIESGPAGGVAAAGHVGRQIGEANLVSFDMGGTTAKICMITGNRPGLAKELEVARMHRFRRGSGLPLKVPSVEMIEIGAGGGSIARVDMLGLLKVGPDSAGADPGPACYGLGGHLPTVTDANLLLGYLDSGFFLGGEMPLERTAAERAIHTHLSEPMGMSIIEAAMGVHRVVNENMARAARVYIAERGGDPRAHTLVAFGGAGPVHAYGIARLLGMKRFVCPMGAGVFSALGFLVAPLSVDLSRSYLTSLRRLDVSHLNRIYRELEERATNILTEAGADFHEIHLERTADVRYFKQVHEVTVPIPNGEIHVDHIPVILENFKKVYSQLFGWALEGYEAEAITWRLRAWVDRKSDLFLDFAVAKDGSNPLKGARNVYFPEERQSISCRVFDRYRLKPGESLEGPAVVEERESTVVIGPSGEAHVDAHLNLLVETG